MLRSKVAPKGHRQYRPRSVRAFFRRDWRELSDYGRSYVYYLYRKIAELEARIKELEAREAQGSSNSNRPPSTDQIKPNPKTLRETQVIGRPKRKHPGAQTGHKGSTLQQTERPDTTCVENVHQCLGCGQSLKDEVVTHVERRQVFDIPIEFRVSVTEYRVEHKNCPHCEQDVSGSFPKDVNAPVQYGPNLKALAAYLMHAQMLPYNRVQEVLRELFGVDMGHGTIKRINELYFGKLDVLEEAITEHLEDADVVHVDETGLNTSGKQAWLHVRSNDEVTLLKAATQRGGVQTKDLKNYSGYLVHDHWHPYYALDGKKHVACNAHHLRELTFVSEDLKEGWAGKMKEHLLGTLEIIENAKKRNQSHLTQHKIGQIEARYLEILKDAEGFYRRHPPPKTGIARKGYNLMKRLRERQAATLAFVHDFKLPFTNNQAERDLRMAKVKQKVSGSFRSEAGMRAFARIRSYISTARKQSWPVLYALQMAIKDKVLIPAYPL
jgi:transposase